MTISISNLIVQEATPGIVIGTLSTDATSTGTFSLYHDSNNNFLQIFFAFLLVLFKSSAICFDCLI